jgi:hypothetical protein
MRRGVRAARRLWRRRNRHGVGRSNHDSGACLRSRAAALVRRGLTVRAGVWLGRRHVAPGGYGPQRYCG